ncbi:MAG: hypothetical protein WAW23_05595 [Candidatus Methanoperedens sp.]
MKILSKINIVDQIEKFVYVKGLREPLYGFNNQLIGFFENGSYYIIGTKLHDALRYHPTIFNP